MSSIGERAFYGCESLKDVTISDSVTKIGNCAFAYCSSLVGGEEGFELPDSVKYIGDYAFLGCENLSYIDLGQGVEHIGEDIFDRCSELKEIFSNEKIIHFLETYYGDEFNYGLSK